MQIHIDTTTDSDVEYRAARAALNELLGESLPVVYADNTPKKSVLDDFRAVVQAEDDAEAAAAFGIPPASPQVQAMVDELAAGLQPVPDPAAQYIALGGTVTPPEVDKHGLPWDVRIHAGGKTKNADGSWRGKRGVSSDLVASVTAELTGGRAPAPAVAPPMAPPAPPPVTQAPPPPPSGPTFMDVTQANMAAIQAGKWTAAQAVALAQSLGLESIAGLQGRPDLIPTYLEKVPA